MVAGSQNALEAALDHAERLRPGGLPRALPVGHIGTTEHLAKVFSSGQLKPRYCKVMRKSTLYLFYGGLFYRSRTSPTLEESAYPVAFLFHPAVLHASDVHYPFDTGAMARGMYGERPPTLRTYKKSVSIRFSTLTSAKKPHDVPRLLVKHLYATNHQYMAGVPDNHAVKRPMPIPDLVRFIIAEADDSDHRRACIETQRHSPLPLKERLLWLGYPDVFQDEVHAYFRSIEPHVPKTWSYPSFVRYRPSDICAMLDGRAYEVLEDYLSEELRK